MQEGNRIWLWKDEFGAFAEIRGQDNLLENTRLKHPDSAQAKWPPATLYFRGKIKLRIIVSVKSTLYTIFNETRLTIFFSFPVICSRL